ncbi:MAG: hypothetical protein IJJ38_11695 [Lachnospiraceae bacterium]|nr:hypothetical protein [Lachnospiraceae bacterium]
MKRQRNFFGTAGIILFILIIACLAAGYAVLFHLPAGRLTGALREGNIQEAEAIYERSFKGRRLGSALLAFSLRDLLNDTLSACGSGETDLQSAKAVTEEIAAMEIPSLQDDAKRADGYVAALCESHLSYERGLAAEREGDLTGAIRAYGSVIEEDPSFADADKRRAALAADYRARILAETESEPRTMAGYKEQLRLLEEAAGVLPDDQTLTDRLLVLKGSYGDIVKAAAMREAGEAVSEKRYEAAIPVLEEALEAAGPDEELSGMLIAARTNYISRVKKEAARLIREGDFGGAEALIDEAESVVPDDRDFLAWCEKTRESRPLPLRDAHVSGSAGYEAAEEGKVYRDRDGTYYNDENLMILHASAADAGRPYVVFRAGGDYVTLAGTAGVSGDGADFTGGALTVYGDGEVIGQIPDLTSDGPAREFSVPTGGADEIRVELSLPAGCGDVKVLLKNVFLYQTDL